MIQIFQKKNGAVSVFLAIVLVPMMIIASIMIDYGRVQLGRAMASSAGDLALNTALTDYDNVLKDVYGLMATSQNNDELLEKLEDYYTSSIVAQGVSKSDADDYVGQIMDYIKNSSDNSSVDFMNMGNIEFSVEEPKAASLVNPALLRGQIVNFMKYRAPINGGVALLESLKSFSHLSKQMEIVENKQKYYEEHASLLEDCEAAWGYMAKYRALFGNKQQFQDIKTCMDEAIDNYNKINSKMIHNYYNNMPTRYFNRPVTCHEENGKWILNYDDGQQVQISTYHTDKKSKNSNYVPSESDLAEEVEALEIYMRSNSTFVDIAAKYGGQDKYSIQVATQANINKNADFASYKNLYKIYTDFEDIYNVLSDENKNSTVEITEKKNGKTVTYSYKVKLKSNENQEDDDTQEDNTENDSNTNQNEKVTTKKLSDYYKELNSIFVAKMNSLNTATYPIFWQYAAYETEYQKNLEDANTAVSTIGTNVKSYRDKLIEAKGYLDDFKNRLEIIANKVNPNGKSELQQTLNTWNNSASDSSVSNDAIAQQDKAEIEQMKQFIKYDDVKKLLDRVKNVITELDNDIKEIEKYTYCGTFIGDINDLNTLKDKLSGAEGSALSNLSMVTATLDTLSSDIAGRQIKSGNFKADWSGESDKNPVFSEDQYRFYTYLYNNYDKGVEAKKGNVNSDDTTKAKNEVDNTKDSIKEAGNKSKDDAKKGNDVSSGSISGYYSENSITAPSKSDLYKDILTGAYGDVPSIGDDAADKGNTSSGLSGMFSKLGDFLKNAAIDVRDYIFIEEYIMNMFSYNTYEAEIKNKLDEKNLDASEYANKAKTLTNVPINKDNNYSYLQEVEYIIYGDNGTTKTYATIFGIRLAMNCIYAFTSQDIRDGAYAIAAMMFGTPPLTALIPVAKNGLIFAVAIAESGLDLSQLKEGKAVPLVKDNSTWCISFKNLGNFLKNQAAEVLTEGVDKISNMAKGKVNEWLDYSEEELKDKVNDKSGELTDLVKQMETNVNQEIDRYVGVVTNELTTLCTKANDMLMYGEDDLGNKIGDDETQARLDQIRLDYIKRNLEAWWNGEKVNMDTSTLAYKIEQEAVRYLLTSANNEIITILNTKPNESIDKVNEAATGLQNKITYLSDNITKSVKESCTEINNYISNIRSNLQQAANKGVDKFRDELNNGISNLFGTGNSDSNSLDIGKSNTSSIASKFKFRYSDYLRVFLMVALVTNSDNTMAKMSDILEANMSKITGKTFKLENSYTYIKINAEVDVKPLLLTLPWMNDTTEKYLGGKNYYRVEYTGISGY